MRARLVSHRQAIESVRISQQGIRIGESVSASQSNAGTASPVLLNKLDARCLVTLNARCSAAVANGPSST